MKICTLFLTALFLNLSYAEDCYNCATERLLSAPVVLDWPIEYISIEKANYERNPKASFCKRPLEMIDTIVLHHSETPSTDSPERINQLHLARGTSQDPWYMIAYSYAVNAPYSGAASPQKRVTEGRPLELVGAHAGTNAFAPMDKEQTKMWEEGKITCGRENGDFQVDPSIVSNGNIKANVTTIGVVVIGNYAPFSKVNPNGYSRSKPRYPTQATQDMIARLSCQLQKRLPRIKSIKWHSYYHATSCPGTIKQYISQIKTLARKYGCEFN